MPRRLDTVLLPRHQGPAVNLPEGIFCTACAEVLRDERPMTYTKVRAPEFLLHGETGRL